MWLDGAVGIGRAMRRPAALAAVLFTLAAAVLLVPAALAATTRACGSVRDPYPRHALRRRGPDADRRDGRLVPGGAVVARGAHRKALGLTPDVSGIRTFTWNGWKVTGDLRPAQRPLRRDARLDPRALALLARAAATFCRNAGSRPRPWTHRASGL